jgi:hypothetical protein
LFMFPKNTNFATQNGSNSECFVTINSQLPFFS